MIIMESIKIDINTVFTSIKKFIEVNLVDEDLLKKDLRKIFEN